jgi:hypothetical protein
MGLEWETDQRKDYPRTRHVSLRIGLLAWAVSDGQQYEEIPFYGFRFIGLLFFWKGSAEGKPDGWIALSGPTAACHLWYPYLRSDRQRRTIFGHDYQSKTPGHGGTSSILPNFLDSMVKFTPFNSFFDGSGLKVKRFTVNQFSDACPAAWFQLRSSKQSNLNAWTRWSYRIRWGRENISFVCSRRDVIYPDPLTNLILASLRYNIMAWNISENLVFSFFHDLPTSDAMHTTAKFVGAILRACSWNNYLTSALYIIEIFSKTSCSPDLRFIFKSSGGPNGSISGARSQNPTQMWHLFVDWICR